MSAQRRHKARFMVLALTFRWTAGTEYARELPGPEQAAVLSFAETVHGAVPFDCWLGLRRGVDAYRRERDRLIRESWTDSASIIEAMAVLP